MNKLIKASIFLFLICLATWYYSINKEKNNSSNVQIINTVSAESDIALLQKVKDLRLPEHDVCYIKIHLLDEEGKYLKCSKIDFWEVVDGQLGKGGASNTLDDGETIVIRPFVKESDVSVRRSLKSNKHYAVYANSKNFGTGFSEKFEFVTPGIIDGKKEYEVFIRFTGAEDPLKQLKTISGKLSNDIDGNSYTINYLVKGKLLTKVIPKGNKFEIKVPELGGELMVGGGDKSAAILHMQSVNNLQVDNATFIDQGKLVEYEISFQALEKNVIVEFMSSHDFRLPLGWVKIPKGENKAKVFLVPGTYYYRFSQMDSSRDINKNPDKMIILGQEKTYQLIFN